MVQEFRSVLDSARSRFVVSPDGERVGTAYDGLAVPVFAGMGCSDALPDNPDLDVLDWAPPPWLVRVYGVFGGIGCWWPDQGVRWATHSVTPLTRHIRFGEEIITYDPADIVRIAPDEREGPGGGWVLIGRDQPVIGRFGAADHGLWVPADAADELRAFQALTRHLVRGWTEGIGPGVESGVS